MTLELTIPESLVGRLDAHDVVEFRCFLQCQVNRYVVGALQYGATPRKRKRYMTRLSKELRAYRASGNAEQLFNIANYAYLESAAPENRKLHFDPAAASVTRGLIGKLAEIREGE